MIAIINNIMTNHGYKQIDIDLPFDEYVIRLFCPADGIKREEYFVTLQLHKQSDVAAQKILEKTAQILFEKISNSGLVDQTFEKNCTMFLCHDESMIERHTILSIEEDLYNFKKNIITYTPQELETLKVHLTQNNINKITNSVINEIINSEGGNAFLEFKKNHKISKFHYTIILKIALKLPFFTYTPQVQELINLSLDIEKSLSPQQSKIYNKLMNLEYEWTDENIDQQVERVWGDLV